MGNTAASPTNQLGQGQVSYGQTRSVGRGPNRQPAQKLPGGLPQQPQGLMQPQGQGLQSGMQNFGITPYSGSYNPQGFGGMAYGNKVNPDGSFTNANGSTDWVVGAGPQRSWGGQEIATGKGALSADPGSGDALGIPRGTPQYRQAVARHQAWIQQNLDQGRTLADLGIAPHRGGGLATYQQLGSTFRLPSTGL